MSQLDKLPIALAEANAGDFDQAIATMDDLWVDLYEKKIGVSEHFEETYINNYVWILGGVAYSPSENGDDYWAWVKSQWDRLKKSHKFIKLKINWKDDAEFQQSLALTELKFSPTNENLNRAKDRIKSAIEYEDSPVNQSYLYYNLAILSLMSNNIDEAVHNLKIASRLHPDDFLIEDWGKYKASYLGEPEFKMWQFLANEFNIPDLKPLMENAFKLASTPNKTNSADAKSRAAD